MFVRETGPADAGDGPFPAGPTPSDLAEGLSLRDAKDPERVVLDIAGKATLPQASGELWAALNVALDPGSYLLRLQFPWGEAMEQTVVALRGWQTQVFLTMGNYPNLKAHEQVARRADLTTASQLFVRLPDPAASAGAPPPTFDPDSTDLRLTELVRIGLSDARSILPEEEFQEFLSGHFRNPMLGI